MSFLGSQFWHHGPESLDWTLDLEKGTFGPLHVHSTIDDVKKHLGRPDDPQVLGKPHRCRYHRFNLFIELEPDLTIWEIEIDTENAVEESKRAAFNPKVKLPGGQTLQLRDVTVQGLRKLLGEPTRLDGNKWAEHVLEYDQGEHTISVDVNGEQVITALGFTTLGG